MYLGGLQRVVIPIFSHRSQRELIFCDCWNFRAQTKVSQLIESIQLQIVLVAIFNDISHKLQ